jgi:transposase InsO family protein
MWNQHQLTIPYTPEQNGVAERLNRTLLDSARTMLKHVDCDQRWWAEAVSTACYIKNRITTTGLPNDVTPHEVVWQETEHFALACFRFKVLVCNAEITKKQTGQAIM